MTATLQTSLRLGRNYSNPLSSRSSKGLKSKKSSSIRQYFEGADKTARKKSNAYYAKLKKIIEKLNAAEPTEHFALLKKTQGLLIEEVEKDVPCIGVVKVLFEFDLPLLMIDLVTKVEFEAKKVAVAIFSALFEAKSPSLQESMSSYTVAHDRDILTQLLLLLHTDELALHGGTMFRSCFSNTKISTYFVKHSATVFKELSLNIVSNVFDVATDAFFTLTNFLNLAESLSPTYFNKNYENIAMTFRFLMESNAYVAQRQSVTLLQIYLFDRKKYGFMQKFINERKNLICIMQLMRDPSVEIRRNAFHVFKVFAANPTKSEPILKILALNKTKLVEFMDTHSHLLSNGKREEEEQSRIREVLNAL